MGLSIEFAERLTGAYRRGSGRDLPLFLELAARSVEGRPGTFRASGSIRAEGLTDGSDLEGTIALLGSSRLSYELTFVAAGEPVRLSAAKRDLYVDPYAAFTTLRGALLSAAGARVAEVAVRFDARGDLGWWFERLRVRYV